MNRPVFVGLVALIVVGSVLGASSPAVMAESGNSVSSADRTGAQLATASTYAAVQDDVGSGDFDTTSFEITVHENGSATWTFRHEQRLDGNGDETETEARNNFQAFAEEFESGDTEFGLYERFSDQAELMIESGNANTDREMEARNFNRSATIDGQFNPIGVVEMSFLWDGFAETENGEIVVGDVFQDIYITEDQSIVIEAGDGLTFQNAEPEPQYVGASLEDADSVQWSGEREFLDGHPRVTLEPAGNDTSWLPVGVALLVLLGAGVGLALYHRRRQSTATEATETPAPPLRTDSETEPAATQTDDQSVEPLSDDELVTDEDRVVRLIRENGGRMKQVNIVDETGWSKSKVSMLLSEMEDDGTISKLRVGRENIVSLEGFEPEATKSPFEE
ncbi:helix-turn-helix transcriptional regulator [Natrialbaceae archaeon A-arb3/5]